MTPIDNLRFLADWNRDANRTAGTGFTHALSDITDYVLRAEWTTGFNTPYQMVTPPSQMTLILDNSNGDWNIGRASAKFYGLLQRDVLIQVRWWDGTTTRYPIVVKIIDIQLTPGAWGPRTITVTCQDYHADLMSVIYDPVLSTNHTTSAAITDMLDTGILPIPYASRWWVVGASALDTDTVLFSRVEGYTTYIGKTTLDYVGDNLDAEGNGVSALAFIEEMCTAEMDGRFLYINTSGYPRYIFFNRHSFAQNYDVTNVISTTPADFMEGGVQYDYGYNQCNYLDMTVYPRKAGSAGTELARTTSPMKIPGTRTSEGNSRTFTLRYRDPDNPSGTCAATTIITPVASTDYTGNLASDGTGEDYTSNLVVTVINKTNAVDVTVSNTALGDVYLTLLKLRGTPLTAQQPASLKSVDALSIEHYGMYKQAKTIAGVDDIELIQSYADYTVHNFNQPRTEYRRVTVDMQNTDTAISPSIGNLLSMGVSKVIRITDDWMNDSAAEQIYWIAGQRHMVDALAHKWTATWMLERYLTIAPWCLDDTDLSVLDASTQLSF
jgi:hypothetical protein